MKKNIKSIVENLRQKAEEAAKKMLSVEDFLPSVAETLKLLEELEVCQTDLGMQGEEQIMTILRTTIDGFYLVDTEGRILDVNDSYCSMIGYSRAELLKMKVKDIEAADTEEVIKKRNKQILETGYARFETRHLRKDGRVIDIEASVNFLIAQQPWLFCFMRDITERKEFEESIKKQKEEFELIFNNIPAQIWYKDTLNNFVRVNRQVCADLGMTNDQIEGHSAEELFPSFAKKYYEDDLEVINSGNPKLGIIEQINTASGELRWVHTDKMPVLEKDDKTVHLIALVQDITERKRTEERLHIHSEIMNQMNEAVYLLRMEDGVIVYTNSRFEEMFGYERGEMLGKHVSIVNAPNEKSPEETAKEIMDNLAKNGRWDGEVNNIKKDGTTFWSHAKVSIFEHSHFGKVLVAVHEDITERKRAEEELNENNKLIQNIVNNIPSLIYLLDLDGKYILANQKLETLTGISNTELIGNTRELFFPKEIADQHRENDLKVINSKKTLFFEEENLEANGKHFYWTQKFPLFDKNNQVYAVGGISTDITDRKKADEYLKKSEHNLAEAERIGNSGSWEYDVATDTASWSANMFRIFDVNPEMPKELVFKYFVENLVHPDDRDHVLSVFQDALIGKIPYDLEYRTVKKDGSIRIINAKAETLWDENGKAIRLIGKVEDITERKEGEESLKELNQFNKQIINSAQEGIIVYSPDLKYMVWNPYMEKLSGIPASEVLGKYPLDLFPFLKDAGVIDIINKALNGEICTAVDFPFHVPSIGRTGWTSDSTGPLRNAKGEIIGALSTVRDITEEKKAQMILKQQERQLASMVGNLPGFIYRCKYDKYWTMLYISEGCKSVTGYMPEDFIDNKKIAYNDIIRDEYQPILFKEWEKALSKKIVLQQEYQIITSNNEIKWVWERGIGVFDENGCLLLLEGYVEDITERKQAEVLLKESEERWRRAIASSPVPIMIHDEDDRVLQLSAGWTKYSGYTIDDIPTLEDWTEKAYGERSRSEKEYIDQLFDIDQATKNKEWIINTKTGSKRIWDFQTTPLGRINNGKRVLHSMAVDITERKLAEKARQESQHQLSSIFNTVGDVIFLLAVEPDGNYRYISINPAFCNLTGLCEEMIVGKLVGEVIPEPSLSMVLGKYRQAIKENSIVRWEEISDYPAGRLIGDVSVTPVVDNKGMCTHLVGSVHDVTGRKKVEEALYNSETRLRTLVQTIPDLIWLKDTEGVYLSCNAMFERFFGASEAEILGKTDYDFFDRELADFFHEHDRLAMEAGKPTSNEEWITFANDGHRAFLDTIKSPMYDSGGALIGVLGIGRDITKRKRAEVSLQESEEKLRTIMGQSSDFIGIADVNGFVIYASSSAESYFLYTSEEICGHHFMEFIVDSEATKAIDVFRDMVDHGASLNSDWMMKRKDGSTFIGNIIGSKFRSGETNGVLVVIRDVTKRKKEEQELIKAKEKAEQDELKLRQINKELEEKNVFIQTILDNLPIGLALNDSNEGDAVYMNKKFEEIYGWTSKEITSIDSFFEKVYPDDEYRKQIVERIMIDINSGNAEKMHWENISVTRKDGSKRTVNAVNIPLIEQNTMVSTVMDVTALHLIQNDLVNAKEHAEESDRLKSAFLANMSHEIRTPMNGILGFSALLKEPKLTGKEQKEYLSIIEKSGARMLSIINDIMSISKVEAGQMDVNISETNVNNQLKYIYTFFRPEAKRKGLKLRCKTQFPTKKALLKTDKEKLYAILTNLIKNALKFTCDGSIEFGYELKEKCLEFFVKDTGIGFSPEHKEIIFERFRQVSESLTRNYEGAGLGLSISKAYVEMLGGKIWVESEQGKGSAFYFTLPYKDEQKEKTFMKNIVPANVTKSQVRNLKILIAEDDKISERLLTIAVKIFSSEVLIVKNGMDAVEACRNQPDIDLVLMDIQMPQMDGYEATRRIRQFNRKVIIIAQTAYTLAGDRILAIEAGCDDYIPKPIDKALLTALINKYFKKGGI